MDLDGDDVAEKDLSESPHDEGYGFFLAVNDGAQYQRIHDRINQKGYFTDRVPFDRVRVSYILRVPH